MFVNKITQKPLNDISSGRMGHVRVCLDKGKIHHGFLTLPRRVCFHPCPFLYSHNDAVVYFISTHSLLTLLRTCAISNVPVVSMLAAMMGMPVYVCLELRNVKVL